MPGGERDSFNGGEKNNSNVETGFDDFNKVGEKAQENLDSKFNTMNNRAEKSSEKAEQEARMEANRQAEFAKGMEDRGNKKGATVKTPTYTKKAPQAQKKAVYHKTLKTIQKEMTPASRTFSKVIHNPVVEKTSEVVGSTVARPVPIFAGSLSALVLTAIVYSVAKYYGYVLSGFEWIATFIIGWVIGMLIDWIRIAILGKKA